MNHTDHIPENTQLLHNKNNKENQTIYLDSFEGETLWIIYDYKSVLMEGLKANC